jgi:hypothetical protein
VDGVWALAASRAKMQVAAIAKMMEIALMSL